MSGIKVVLGIPYNEEPKLLQLDALFKEYLESLNACNPNEWYGTDREIAGVFMVEFIGYLKANLK